jgi:UDP-2,3-diacylglucosamine pyrophosphatase LpxH
MLVFLSDIHFSDGTAGPPNVPASAFQGVYEHIGKMAKDANAERLEIIFLGDVFDLIRTSRWHCYDEENRPWGGEDGTWTDEQDKATSQILDYIVKQDQNKAALKILASNPHENTIKTFIPGNHDRIVNFSPHLRNRVKDLLGLDHDSRSRFPHYFASAPARTFARHGHEFDRFNFGGSETFSQHLWTEIPQSDYDKTPIGDLLAAEISARLPQVVMDRLPGGKDEYPLLAKRLRDLFDVRPAPAMLSFLSYQVRNFKNKKITDAINGGFHDVVKDFHKLTYIQRWIENNDRWYHPFDKSEELQFILYLGEQINLADLDAIAKAYMFFSRSKGSDNLASDAAADFRRLDTMPEFKDSPAEFVLYGHTHQPDQRLISMVGKDHDAHPRMYLNTGMWRPMHNQGLEGGFASWDTLVYSMIYEPGEVSKSRQVNGRPMYKVWTGGLQR